MKKLFYVIALSAIAGFVLSSCVDTANKEAESTNAEFTPAFIESISQYNKIGRFSEGFACVKKDDKWGFVNTNGMDTFRGSAYEKKGDEK